MKTLGLRIEKIFYLKAGLADHKTFLTGFSDLANRPSLAVPDGSGYTRPLYPDVDPKEIFWSQTRNFREILSEKDRALLLIACLYFLKSISHSHFLAEKCSGQK